MKIKKPEMYGDKVEQGNKMLSYRCGPYDVKNRGEMTLGKSTAGNATNASPIGKAMEGGQAPSFNNKR